MELVKAQLTGVSNTSAHHTGYRSYNVCTQRFLSREWSHLQNRGGIGSALENIEGREGREGRERCGTFSTFLGLLRASHMRLFMVLKRLNE